MRWKEIKEAPLADFGTHGDLDNEGSFRKDDLRAMQNPKWVKKLGDFFSRVPQDINLYLVNHPPALSQRYDDNLKGLGPTTDHTKHRYRQVSNHSNWSGIRSMAEIEKVLGKVPPNYEQSITVVLYENEGDERIPLTPWMVAHRVAHAIMLPDRGEIGAATSGFNKAATAFIQGASSRLADNEEVKAEMAALGLNRYQMTLRQEVGLVSRLCKFKSAEHGAIVRPGEMVIELLTQYLVQGKITFKRMNIDDAAGRQELPAIDDENAQIFKLANDFALASIFNRNGDLFAEQTIGRKRPLRPRDGYVAYNDEGEGIAAFSDESRVKDYEERGLTVKYNKATPQSKAAYRKWEQKMQQYAALFNQWREEGRFKDNSTINDRMDQYLTKAEETLNGAANAVLVRLIGKAVVL